MCRHSSPIQSRRRSLLPAIFCQFSSEKLYIFGGCVLVGPTIQSIDDGAAVIRVPALDCIPRLPIPFCELHFIVGSLLLWVFSAQLRSTTTRRSDRDCDFLRVITGSRERGRDGRVHLTRGKGTRWWRKNQSSIRVQFNFGAVIKSIIDRGHSEVAVALMAVKLWLKRIDWTSNLTIYIYLNTAVAKNGEEVIPGWSNGICGSREREGNWGTCSSVQLNLCCIWR